MIMAEEKVVEKTMEVRAIDPDAVMEMVQGNVTYRYRQPAGVYMDSDSRKQGNRLMDDCLLEAVGLKGATELRAKGHPWSKIVPPLHALQLFVVLYKAANITAVEAEG